jgi:acyl-CoA thioester hydrolase
MALKDDPRRMHAASYPWALIVPTRFTDMDPNRHLNNVAILQHCEEGRVRFLAMLRHTFPAIGQPHFVVAHVSADYLAEGQYPADITLALAVGTIGASSYRIVQGLFQNGTAFALADSVLVHRNAALRPAPMPGELRNALAQFAFAGATPLLPAPVDRSTAQQSG